MNQNTMKPQMTTKDLCMLSKNWVQTKNKSVKRTFGGLRYYQKILRETEESRPESQVTGNNIMDLIKNFNYSLNNEGKIVIKEKS